MDREHPTLFSRELARRKNGSSEFHISREGMKNASEADLHFPERTILVSRTLMPPHKIPGETPSPPWLFLGKEKMYDILHDIE